jgi:hypothetical protein
VLSSGRSGSTLLELLLATHPAVETLGEVMLLPALARDPLTRCGCGRPLTACAVWAPILTGDRGWGAVCPDPLRERLDAGRTLRPALLPDVLAGRARPGTRPFAESYAERALAVMAAARARLTRPGEVPPLVVDASKDPYRLALLAFSGAAELWVVHLVRDPRGYVRSTRRPGDGLARTARRAARWVTQQGLAERLRRTVPAGRWTTLRYEDLAVNPGEVLARLGGRLGLAPAFDPDAFRAQLTHALGGNPMRGRDDPVRLDERWRHDLPTAHTRVCWAVAGPTARRYGYRWSADPRAGEPFAGR